MKILFITSRLPYPPNRGDRLRAYNFIKSIHRQHEIHLISFISNKDELDYCNKLKQYCEEIQILEKKPLQSAISVLLNLWRPEPMQSLYYRSSKMQGIIDGTISSGNFDVIYVHLFRMAQYVLDHHDSYRILDLTDVISHEISRSLPYRNLFGKLLYTIEGARIQQFEKLLIDIFEEIWLISASDLNILSSQDPAANFKHITNGVDINIFHPIEKKPTSQRIIFTGHMGVFHNIDAAQYFAIDVYPEIRKAFPNSRFVIAGAEPANSILDLNSQPNVEVIGFVENLNEELNASQVFVAPLRFAAGIQNKVLEAMAAGIPVIATNIVNEGINAVPGVEIIIADSPEEFITQLSNMFQNDTLCKSIGLEGRNFVLNNYSWDLVLNRINEIEQILAVQYNSR